MELLRLDTRDGTETALYYGARVLRFVVASGQTATLTLEDLEAADHAYPLAVARADLLPVVYDRLAETRRIILAAIARRRREADRTEAPRAISTPVSQTDPSGGSWVPRQPLPIGRPPQGMAQCLDVGF